MGGGWRVTDRQGYLVEASYLGKDAVSRGQGDAREREDFAVIYWPIRET